MVIRLKYGILSILLLAGLCTQAQTNNQAVVTIIGDPAKAENAYAENVDSPPAKQQKLTSASNTIEPTLENGFHIRFEIESDQFVNHGGSTSYSYSAYPSYSASGGGNSKVKKHSASMAEKSFNVKKRLKYWLPERKKRYRPHLCGRF